MERLDVHLSQVVSRLSGRDEGQVRKAARAGEVRARFQRAAQDVYGPSADFVLSHVNAVYVLDAGVEVSGARDRRRAAAGRTQLVVYTDDSLVRSDVDARQEFLKARMNDQGEAVDVVKVLASRRDMRARHPYTPVDTRRDKDDALVDERAFEEGAEGRLSAQAEGIGDDALRESIKKAIKADFKRST